MNINSQVQQQGKVLLPALKVSKVVINSAVLQQIDKNNQLVTTETLAPITWDNISTEEELSGEKVGTLILENLIIELAAHSKKIPLNH